MVSPARRPFKNHPRLTKLQELLICNRRHDVTSSTMNELACAQAEFALAIENPYKVGALKAIE